jgi:hypothetical protein
MLEGIKSYRHSPDGFVVLPLLIAAQLREIEGKYHKEFMVDTFIAAPSSETFWFGQLSRSGALY